MSTDEAAAVTAPTDVPRFTVDLHTDEVLADPYPTFTQLREAGPVVWLDTYGYYAITRHAEASDVLSDWDTYTSSKGVGFNEYWNSNELTLIHTAGEHHDRCRRVLGQPLRPERLRELEPSLREYAENLVAKLLDRGSIDGVADLAKRMPLDKVTELVGLDEVGKSRLFNWGVAGFDSIGPMHQYRTGPALEMMAGYAQYAMENIPAKVDPDGWAAQLFENGRQMGLSHEVCVGLMTDYVYPGMDTTINAISNGLLLFAKNPDQWERLRNDRSLMTNAIYEIVRLTTPIQYFTRVATRDVVISGAAIPAGSRLLVMYASADHDERKFPDPKRFDITRDNAQDHLAWGRGKHGCMGKPFARLEMATLFDVLADQVERFVVGEYSYSPNNLVRGLGRMELSFIRARPLPASS